MKTSRWPRLKKWLKRLLFGLVTFITLAALSLAIEGHRAKRAWDACQRELAARGESLDWQTHVPSPVPEEQNFLATPLLATCFGFGAAQPQAQPPPEETQPCRELQHLNDWIRRLPGAGDWRSGSVVPLVEWQQELRATNISSGSHFGYGHSAEAVAQRYGVPQRTMQRPGTRGDDIRPPDTANPDTSTTNNTTHEVDGQAPVLAQDAPPPNGRRDALSPDAFPQSTPLPSWADLWSRPPASAVDDLRFLLGRNQADLGEIRAAAQRPYARLRLDPDVLSESLMTRFAALKGLSQPFRVSAWTELNAGNPEAALTDIDTVLALSDAASSQPLLIGALVRIAMVEQALQPIWAGLAKRMWEDTQLERLDARLERVNIVADVHRCLRGERAFALAMITAAPGSGDPQPGLPMDAMRQVLRKWPRAFVYRNQINIARAYQRVLLDRLDPTGPSVRSGHTSEDQALRKQYGTFSPYNVFAPQLLLALEKSVENAAASQATVTLARVACALERHRLAFGHYPKTLDELTPKFLVRIPPDPVNGGLLRYRREDPDRFTLYSVALNGVDDGGTSAVHSRGSSALLAPTGDWVWHSHPADAPTNSVPSPG